MFKKSTLSLNSPINLVLLFNQNCFKYVLFDIDDVKKKKIKNKNENIFILI